MSDDLATLATEATDPRFAQIDRMSVADLAATMNDADRTVPDAVRAALPQVVAAISAVAERMARGGRLIYVGAGTPGRIAVLDASECPPTFSTPPGLVTAIIAGGPSAIVTPSEGAEDDADAGAAAIDDAGVGPLDSVVGIASSGRTPYVVAAVSRARELGAFTVGLTSNVGSDLAVAAVMLVLAVAILGSDLAEALGAEHRIDRRCRRNRRFAYCQRGNAPEMMIERRDGSG